MMSTQQQVITILLMVFVTVLTRALPFIVFPPGHPTPRYIRYLGQVLPLAVFAMLVVYCLKDVQWLSAPHGLPELIGIAVTILVHIWRRQMLWSIAAGTLTYMLLIRLVF